MGSPRTRTVSRGRAINSINEGQAVTDVIDALQPQITAAVLAALGGSANPPPRPSGGSFRPAAGSGSSSIRPANAKYPPAKYQYEYKVANDLTQTYINQQESRDGLEVEGSYG